LLKSIRNTIANFIGGLTALAVILVFNVLYFRLATDEVFGVISLLLTAQLLAPALDFGTGRTAGRILAADLALARDMAGLRDAVATMQVANLAVAMGYGAALALAAPAVAEHWLNIQKLPSEQVATAIMLIGGYIVLLMPRNFVVACLNGMKRQVLSNLLTVSFTLMRGVAGLVALQMSDAPLQAFFLSQIAVQALDSGVCGVVLWRLLPPTKRRPRFDAGVLRRSWRFAAGDGTAALIGACLAQGDKILLSALLPLSSYGAYALISMIASGVGRFTSPFSAAFLPHFVELTALGRKDELREDYLVSTQLLSCVILPLAAVMIAFAPEIVGAILGPAHPPGMLPLAFALLVAATVLNNLLHLPHGVQLAAGNSATALRFAIVNAIIYVALILIATPRIGVLGPAVSLLSIYAVTFVLFAGVTVRMLGLGVAGWIGNSILRPGLPVVAAVVLVRLVTPGGLGLAAGVAWLVAVSLAGLAAALAFSPRARGVLGAYGSRFRPGRGGS